MIHVAPCSCELHVRIRELEAELAATREISIAQVGRIDALVKERDELVRKEQKARAEIAKFDDLWAGGYKKYRTRAEKAEYEAAKWLKRCEELNDGWVKDKARVAELEVAGGKLLRQIRELEARAEKAEKERDTALYQAGRMTRAEWNAKHMEPYYPGPLDAEQERLHAQEDE